MQENDSFFYQNHYYKMTKGISEILEKIFLAERKRIIEKYKRPGSILDVGCGTAEFLKTMRRAGWKATGIDTSAEVKKYEIEEIKIYCEDLINMKFADRSFDVITLWQVFEHLNNPGKHLTEIWRILKDDGILIVSVPNIESLQAAISRNKWFHLDLPRHKYHFSPMTVSEMLAKFNFSIKKVKHFSLEYNPFGFWQSFFNLFGLEINFAYKYLKRGIIQKEYTLPLRIYTILCTFLLWFPFLVIAFFMSFIESILKRGGTITVIAGKIGNA
jgi:SAM-dependent methyltransferase